MKNIGLVVALDSTVAEKPALPAWVAASMLSPEPAVVLVDDMKSTKSYYAVFSTNVAAGTTVRVARGGLRPGARPPLVFVRPPVRVAAPPPRITRHGTGSQTTTQHAFSERFTPSAWGDPRRVRELRKHGLTAPAPGTPAYPQSLPRVTSAGSGGGGASTASGGAGNRATARQAELAALGRLALRDAL